jgi:hypothetical protein
MMDTELDIQMKINILDLSIDHCKYILKNDPSEKEVEKYKKILVKENIYRQELQDKHPEYFI